MSEERPVYVGTLRVRNVFVPVLLKVRAYQGKYQIAFAIVNESLHVFRAYRLDGNVTPLYESAEEAQKVLDKIAYDHLWKPLKMVEYWEAR